MADRLRSGSLFTGTAALDMAAAEIFGAELAWVAEYEPPTEKNRHPAQSAARLLAHHFPTVPNLGDITATDWDLVAKLAPIDVLTAGWPCQPWSLAGLQLGVDDDRALWPYVGGCIRALRPRWVLLENVPAVVAAGELERVANTLATNGYRFAWVCFPASAVGAPHQRERFFLLAVADAEDERHERPRPARRRRARPADRCVAAPDAAGSGPQGRVGPSAASGAESSAVADAERGGGAPAPDTARRGLGADQRDDAAGQSDVGRRAAADTDEHERERQPVQQRGEAAAAGDRGRPDWAGYGPAIHRWEAVLGRRAPAPTVLSDQYLKRLARHQETVRQRLAGVDRRPVGMRGSLLPPREVRVLNPALPEWMMGLPDGWITGVPGLTRTQQIKLSGNGVVKQQAVAAFRYLLDVLEQDLERAA